MALQRKSYLAHIQVISRSTNGKAMQIAVTFGGHSATRHLRLRDGGWVGYDLSQKSSIRELVVWENIDPRTGNVSRSFTEINGVAA